MTAPGRPVEVHCPRPRAPVRRRALRLPPPAEASASARRSVSCQRVRAATSQRVRPAKSGRLPRPTPSPAAQPVSIRASQRNPHPRPERPRTTRLPPEIVNSSSIVRRQPDGARWSMRSWKSAAMSFSGHGFPRSHGPPEERVETEVVKIPLLARRYRRHQKIPSSPKDSVELATFRRPRTGC